MKALFVINDKGYEQSEEIINSLMEAVDEDMPGAVIKLDIVDNLKDTQPFEDFKEAAETDDFDVYIMNFVHAVYDYRDIEAKFKDVGYYFNNDTEIIIILYNEIEKYREGLHEFMIGKIDANHPKLASKD